MGLRSLPTRLLTATCVLALTASCAGSMQTPASADAEADNRDIVVTATQRENAVQESPVAVTVIGSGSLGPPPPPPPPSPIYTAPPMPSVAQMPAMSGYIPPVEIGRAHV